MRKGSPALISSRSAVSASSCAIERLSIENRLSLSVQKVQTQPLSGGWGKKLLTLAHVEFGPNTGSISKIQKAEIDLAVASVRQLHVRGSLDRPAAPFDLGRCRTQRHRLLSGFYNRQAGSRCNEQTHLVHHLGQ